MSYGYNFYRYNFIQGKLFSEKGVAFLYNFNLGGNENGS